MACALDLAAERGALGLGAEVRGRAEPDPARRPEAAGGRHPGLEPSREDARAHVKAAWPSWRFQAARARAAGLEALKPQMQQKL